MSVQNTNFQSDTNCPFGFMAHQRWALYTFTQWAKTQFPTTSFLLKLQYFENAFSNQAENLQFVKFLGAESQFVG